MPRQCVLRDTLIFPYEPSDTENMKHVIFAMLLCLSMSSYAVADRRGTDGETQTFDADFDKVWGAALAALDDKTIETANKDVGQIITKAEKGHNLLGDNSKTITVKVGHAKPCKVTVHANIERSIQVQSKSLFSSSGTDVISDDDQERAILKAIEKSLAAK